MSDTFNPGPGWRALHSGERDAVGEMLVHYDDMGASVRWVREEPVPPLPTEPYTVIRVTWIDPNSEPVRVLTLDQNKRWYRLMGPGMCSGELAARITGFEVLTVPGPNWEEWAKREAEVRRETAKAILYRVRSCLDEDSVLWESEIDVIAKAFGVEL